MFCALFQNDQHIFKNTACMFKQIVHYKNGMEILVGQVDFKLRDYQSELKYFFDQELLGK